MVPELAAAYVIGLPATAALSGLHAFLFRKKMHSREMQNVQENLRSVGKFWSDSESKIKPYEAAAFTNDQTAYYKTVFWLGIICFFISWLGFFLQLLVMISIRYIARPRLEQKVFSSVLSHRRLSTAEVEAILNQDLQN